MNTCTTNVSVFIMMHGLLLGLDAIDCDGYLFYDNYAAVTNLCLATCVATLVEKEKSARSHLPYRLMAACRVITHGMMGV